MFVKIKHRYSLAAELGRSSGGMWAQRAGEG